MEGPLSPISPHHYSKLVITMATVEEPRTETARYLIVQHMPNLLRRETVNVGVVVEKGSSVCARFVGEDGQGNWDNSKLKRFQYANAYKLWVDHWKEMIEDNSGDLFKELLASSDPFANFGIIQGGVLDRSGVDLVEDVCHYLYGLLVSRGGLTEALADPGEVDEQQVILTNDLRSELRRWGAMGDRAKHPVRPNQPVSGAKYKHRVSYFQRVEMKSWAIEPVDFTVRNKQKAAEHAGWISSKLTDLAAGIEQRHGLSVIPVTIAKYSESDLTSIDAKTGFQMLKDSSEVVNWSNLDDRHLFLARHSKLAAAF